MLVTTITAALEYLGIENEKAPRLIALLLSHEFDIPCEITASQLDQMEMDLIQEEAKHRHIEATYLGM